MSHAFNSPPAKPAFGTLNQIASQTDYLQKLKAKKAYCKSSTKCTKFNNSVESYNHLYLQNKLFRLNSLNNCTLLPFNKTNLIVNLYSKMNLEYACTLINGFPCAPLESSSGCDEVGAVPQCCKNACLNDKTINVNPINAVQFNLTNTIDPVGNLFGKNQCGILNFTHLMTFNPLNKIDVLSLDALPNVIYTSKNDLDLDLDLDPMYAKSMTSAKTTPFNSSIINKTLTQALTKINSTTSQALATIDNKVTIITKNLNLSATQAITTINTNVTSATNTLNTTTNQSINNINTNVTSATSTIRNATTQATSTIGSVVNNTTTHAITTINTNINQATSTIRNATIEATSTINDIVNDATTEATSTIVDIVNEATNHATSTIGSLVNNSTSTINSNLQSVISTLDSATNQSIENINYNTSNVLTNIENISNDSTLAINQKLLQALSGIDITKSELITTLTSLMNSNLLVASNNIGAITAEAIDDINMAAYNANGGGNENNEELIEISNNLSSKINYLFETFFHADSATIIENYPLTN